MQEGEDVQQARRITRRAWSFVALGLVLLVGGSVAVLLLGQLAERIVLGAVAAPVLVLGWTFTIRQVMCERRDGQQPPSREAARRAPLLTVGNAALGWGLAFALFQAMTPEPALDSALLRGVPFAAIWLIGVGPVWRLRRELNREKRTASSPTEDATEHATPGG